jgi:hypothetical protein
MSMYSAQIRFLRELVAYDGAAKPYELQPPTRTDNSARRKCKREGLATFEGGCWHITDEGRATLYSKT